MYRELLRYGGSMRLHRRVIDLSGERMDRYNCLVSKLSCLRTIGIVLASLYDVWNAPDGHSIADFFSRGKKLVLTDLGPRSLKGSVAAVKLVYLALIDSYLWGLATTQPVEPGFIIYAPLAAETLRRQTIAGRLSVCVSGVNLWIKSCAPRAVLPTP